ncbi:NADPH-dependent butanol dehydrogenase-like, partial [Teleopsis dalmanni]|uniref:NADPH-dependent butanol dehydrogenase-like n=1 Tax=Teleopsis dalmanni TaxID=139649 RepID=UPI0018CE1D21
KSCGETAINAIHNRILTEIKRQLMFADISHKEIAFDLGFNSPAALNKFVKAKLNLTPTQLQQELAQKKINKNNMSKLFVAGEVFHGAGSLEELKNIKGKKAIIVTGGSSMKKSGALDRAIAFLEEAGLETKVFDGVEEDPSSATSFKGAEVMNEFQPDWIIGLGGCSAIDAAKMMWVFYEHPDASFDAMTKPFTVPTLRNKAKFIAIPSTSGTGTETTGLAVITDREKGVKYPIVSYELTPDIAIVDGEICASMPAHITANTD